MRALPAACILLLLLLLLAGACTDEVLETPTQATPGPASRPIGLGCKATDAACQAIEAAFAKAEAARPASRPTVLPRDQEGRRKAVAAHVERARAAAEAYVAVTLMPHPDETVRGRARIAVDVRIGEINRSLAEYLARLPCPNGVDERQCGPYKKQLAARAEPFRKEAWQHFIGARDAARAHGIDDTWSRSAIENAGALERQSP